jgi:uncharacterized protein YndB with AHSA1/START domain
MTMAATDLVVRRSVRVQRTVEDAFRVFTEGIAGWWPVETHSIHGAGAIPVVEGEPGGRVYERGPDGTEAPWGSILVWDPPHRLVISWRVNPASPAPTEVDVRFVPDGDGARVELEHRGWERYGDKANESMASYSDGWRRVLGRFAAALAAG